jgi:hypothetical protein
MLLNDRCHVLVQVQEPAKQSCTGCTNSSILPTLNTAATNVSSNMGMLLRRKQQDCQHTYFVGGSLLLPLKRYQLLLQWHGQLGSAPTSEVPRLLP